jgi:hypothetical protein
MKGRGVSEVVPNVKVVAVEVSSPPSSSRYINLEVVRNSNNAYVNNGGVESKVK